MPTLSAAAAATATAAVSAVSAVLPQLNASVISPQAHMPID
jgi:hypothetical protein